MSEISVILPTYNRVDLLPNAVKSVLNQTHQDIELIIINDSSGDSTEQYLDSISDDRVSTINLNTNSGRSEARNIGLNQATGDYVAFIDDDDRWIEDKLEIQLERLSQLPESYCAVYSWGVVESSENKEQLLDPTVDGDIYPEILVDDYIYPFTSLLVSSDTLSETGGFDTTFSQAEDWDFCIRIAQNCKIDCVQKPLVRVTKHGGNITTDLDHATLSRKLIWNKYTTEIYKYDLTDRYIAIWERQKAIKQLRTGGHFPPIVHMIRSCRYNCTAKAVAFFLLSLLGPKPYQFLRGVNSHIEIA